MLFSMTPALRRRSAALAASLLTTAGLAGIAQAQPQITQAHINQFQIQVQGAAAQGLEVNSRALRFGDLNLASNDGRARLETRLKVAAGTVCGKRSLWTVNPPADYTRCYDRALSDARAQIDQRLAAAGETDRRLAAD